jgi:4-amino-4-deoxy-L-arabinose transferase-like glycosyltransferase
MPWADIDRDGNGRMKPVAWKQLALVLALALLVRVAAASYWQSRLHGQFGMPDSESYWTLAQTIAAGEPYAFGPDGVYRVFRTPGYPLLLAPILAVSSGTTAVMLARIEAALLGTVAVAGVWWLGRQLFDQRAALLAAVFAAFYPGAIALSVMILSEAPFCALLPMQLALWIAASKAESPRRAGLLAILAGVVAGLATLMRPSWLLFAPFAVVVSVLVGVPSPKGRMRLRHLAIGATMIVGLAAAMTPWWIRNACVTGQFVPTTLQVGASLYDGLNPEATGASDMDFVPRFVEDERRQMAAEARDRSGDLPSPADGRSETASYGDSLEVRLDRRLRSESIGWARSHPGEALRLAAVKFARIWNIWPNEAQFSAPLIRLGVLVTYVPLLALGIYGAARTIRRGWPYILCWLPAVYITALHVIFVSSIRYREPAMLGLLVLAAGAAAGRKKGEGGGRRAEGHDL